MKKIISAILCISLLVSILCVPVSATEENTKKKDISGFINGINELTKKYDADKLASHLITSPFLNLPAPEFGCCVAPNFLQTSFS